MITLDVSKDYYHVPKQAWKVCINTRIFNAVHGLLKYSASWSGSRRVYELAIISKKIADRLGFVQGRTLFDMGLQLLDRRQKENKNGLINM